MVLRVRSPILNRYQILQELSTSPESRVLLAEDLHRAGRLCALKIFRIPGERSFESSRREFHVLRKLHHEGIAEVFDFGRLEGKDLERGEGPDLAYLATVYHEGLNLREAFLRLFPESPDRTAAAGRWRIFLEALARICEALEAVHARGLIHYDVKPENLLLVPDPAIGVPRSFAVKILDFGLTDRETTPVGTRVRGTIPFIAPELIRTASADRRSDLFSLGVSIAVAISGQVPFPGGRPDRWLAAARAGRHTAPGRLRPDLPAGLESLIHELLAPDPAARPPAAGAVARRLEEIGGFRLPARPYRPQRSFPSLGWERELSLVRSEIEGIERGQAERAVILLEGDQEAFLDGLALEVEAEARVGGALVASGSSSLPRRRAYQPFAEAIEHLSRSIDLGSPRFARFAGALSLLCPGIRPPAGVGPRLPPLRMRLEVYRFLDLISELFLEAAREKPLVLCLRDLHLAGRESIELLRTLCRAISLRSRREDEPVEPEPSEPARLLIIGTVREVDEGDVGAEVEAGLASLAELSTEACCTRLRLKGIGLDRVSGWLQERLPGLRPGGDLLRRLQEKSGGSLWYLEEFVRLAAAEMDGAERSPEGSASVVPADLSLRLPRRAEDLALERVASLPPGDRRIMELLAVAQSPLTVEEIDATLAPEAPDRETPAIPGVASPGRDRLAALEGLGLVELRDGPAGTMATVVVPRLARAIALRIADEARLGVHRRLALVLGADGEDPGRVPEDAAFHALHGGLPDSFIRHALVAGARLAAAHAYEAAADLLESVIDRLAIDPSALGGAGGAEIAPGGIESLRRHVNEQLAGIHAGRGQWHKAIEKLTLLSGAGDPAPGPRELASIWRRLGEAYGHSGEPANAAFFLEKALALLRSELDRSRPAGRRPESGAGRESLVDELLAALLALARHHLSRDDPDRATKALEECIEHAASLSRRREPACRARILLAEIEGRRNLHDRSLASNLAALAIAREEKNPSLVLEALAATGSSCIALGAYDRAIERLQEAVALARSIESKHDMAASYGSLGTIYHNRADHQRALECFSRSLSLSTQVGDLRGIATSYNNLGLVHRLKDDLRAAAECYKRAIDIFSRTNDQNGMAAAMSNLSNILELEGKYNEALDYSFRALDKRKKAKSRSGTAFSYYRIGKIYQSKGELDKAVTFAEKGLDSRRELGEKMGIAYSSLQLAELRLAQGKHHEAYLLGRAGLKDFESLQNEVGVLMARVLVARVLLHVGKVEEGRRMLASVLDRARKSGQGTMVGSCLLHLGRAAIEVGDIHEAEHRLQEAERLFRSQQSRRELAEVLLESCDLKLEMRHFERVSSLLDEAYSVLEELGVRDLVPFYFLLRGRLEMEAVRSTDPDGPRKFLERGLVEARELRLPDLSWRFHLRLGMLEVARGDAKLARIHFSEAREALQAAAAALPGRLRKDFFRLRERAEVLARATDGAEVRTPAEPSAGSRSEALAVAEPDPAPGLVPGLVPGPMPGLEPGREPEAAPPIPDGLSRDDVLALHRRTLKLHEVASAMGTETDSQKLLETIMDAVLEIVDAERGFLILRAAGADDRTVTVARNLDREEILAPEGKVSGSVAREVLETGKPVLARNAMDDRRFLGSRSVRDLRLRSLVCIPLRFRAEILGVIYLDNRHRRDAFRESDLRILQAFADQAAIAVTNARLIEENRKRNLELTDANRKMESLNVKLRRTVSRRTAQLAVVREDLRDRQSQLEARYRFGNIVGASESMRSIFSLLERVAPTTLPVLLVGESGTGKELIARAIHFNGGQREGRFVSQNCAAISESLLETELFGHTRGAFTGAVAEKKGLFEQADGGTLFLDEVGDTSLGMQGKLLRVLEEGELRPVGGKDSLKVSVRIVSASNRDLSSLVAQGKFREDLFYRLSGLRIRVPSLRERKEDIPLLVEHFLAEAAARSSQAIPAFSREALRALVAHDWPGNVRELRHAIERVLLTSTGTTVSESDLLLDEAAEAGGPPEGKGAGAGRGGGLLPRGAAVDWSRAGSLRQVRDAFEREFLLWCLRTSRGNVADVARRCRMSRESLYRLLRKHRIAEGRRTARPGSGRPD